MKRIVLAMALMATPVLAQQPPQQPKNYGQVQLGNMLMESMGREATTGAALLAAQDQAVEKDKKIADLEAQIKTLEAKGATEPAKPATK